MNVRFSATLLLNALIALCPLTSLAANDKPNIILVLADDIGYECLGAYGGESYQTPALDKLAAAGIRFDHCYAQPLCTPSRVQMMTGIYNVRNYKGWAHLDPSQTTFANLLKKGGYATCMAGKWQLGEKHIATLPKHFGFDESYLFPAGVWQWGPSLMINGQLKEYRPEDYGPDLVSNQACQFINKSQPFFLYYTEHLPHDPWLPTPDSHDGDVKKYATGKDVLAAQRLSNRQNFHGMVEYMDKLFGKLMATLDAQGLRENTLVIFTGDNGTGTGVRSLVNGRTVAGGKGRTTDAGTHVPLIVNWPARIKKPGVCRDLVDFADFLPTICEAAGVPVPSELEVDGRSFIPQMCGEPGRPRDWCYFWFSKDGRSKAAEWARNQRYKLYRTGEFYDLSEDALEENPITDLSPEERTVQASLHDALDRYRDVRPTTGVKKKAANE